MEKRPPPTGWGGRDQGLGGLEMLLGAHGRWKPRLQRLARTPPDTGRGRAVLGAVDSGSKLRVAHFPRVIPLSARFPPLRKAMTSRKTEHRT